MTTIIIAVIIFVIMMLLPIQFSLIFLNNSKGKALDIQTSRVRDPRYFVKSFTNMFDEKWNQNENGGKIFLSRQEDVIEADNIEEYHTIYDSIIFAEKKDFSPMEGIHFEKEIYACQNVYMRGHKVRAICCKKNLVLGRDTQVSRWVDAEGILTVYEDCDLGISASSITRIVIGSNCLFKRLYAPEIFLGPIVQDSHQIMIDYNNVSLEEVSTHIVRNIKVVDDDYADEGVLNETIITKYDIKVLNSLIVKGNIRTQKSIWLCDNTVVYGNLFAEGDIYLGQNVRVYGSIFTQESFYAESGTIIGQHGKIKSVIARGTIIFEKNCQVYGYVGTEIKGLCCPKIPNELEEITDFYKLNQMDEELTYLACTVETTSELDKVIFHSVEEFNGIATYGFRKNEHINEVVIPEGVTKIHSSYFFQCSQLRRVILPSTIKEIGAFAFYGCIHLSEIDIGNCHYLNTIGEAAFEGCKMLREVHIPSSCKVIEESTFCGSGIQRMYFNNTKDLMDIENFVFKDCESLVDIKIPSSVTRIGKSSFYNCTSLMEFKIPEAVTHIDSYAFGGCSKLSSMRIYSNHITLGENVLQGLPKNAKLKLKNVSVKNVFKSNIKRGKDM